jgi:hypothetical protein
LFWQVNHDSLTALKTSKAISECFERNAWSSSQTIKGCGVDELRLGTAEVVDAMADFFERWRDVKLSLSFVHSCELEIVKCTSTSFAFAFSFHKSLGANTNLVIFGKYSNSTGDVWMLGQLGGSHVSDQRPEIHLTETSLTHALSSLKIPT